MVSLGLRLLRPCPDHASIGRRGAQTTRRPAPPRNFWAQAPFSWLRGSDERAPFGRQRRLPVRRLPPPLRGDVARTREGLRPPAPLPADGDERPATSPRQAGQRHSALLINR